MIEYKTEKKKHESNNIKKKKKKIFLKQSRLKLQAMVIYFKTIPINDFSQVQYSTLALSSLPCVYTANPVTTGGDIRCEE